MAIDTYFKNIANAIRTKAGTVAALTPSQMPQAILDIPSGGGESGIVYDWDFTESITDKHAGVDVILTGCTQTSNGLHFDDISQNCLLPYTYIPGFTIEIKFGNINYGGSASNHTSILMIGTTTSNQGLLRRSTGKLSWYWQSWSDIGDMTSINELSNKTLKVSIGESNVDTYIDDVLIGSSSRYSPTLSNATLNIGNARGSSSGGNFYDVYVKSCKVYVEAS